MKVVCFDWHSVLTMHFNTVWALLTVSDTVLWYTGADTRVTISPVKSRRGSRKGSTIESRFDMFLSDEEMKAVTTVLDVFRTPPERVHLVEALG